MGWVGWLGLRLGCGFVVGGFFVGGCGAGLLGWLVRRFVGGFGWVGVGFGLGGRVVLWGGLALGGVGVWVWGGFWGGVWVGCWWGGLVLGVGWVGLGGVRGWGVHCVWLWGWVGVGGFGCGLGVGGGWGGWGVGVGVVWFCGGFVVVRVGVVGLVCVVWVLLVCAWGVCVLVGGVGWVSRT